MHLDRELKGYKIRAGQVPILRILDEEDGIRQDNIRKELHMDKGALAKTIKPLIAEGYIVRVRDLVDKRAYAIMLTDKGRQIMPHLSKIISDWISVLTKGLTPSQNKSAFKLLSRMSENAFDHFESVKNK